MSADLPQTVADDPRVIVPPPVEEAPWVSVEEQVTRLRPPARPVSGDTEGLRPSAALEDLIRERGFLADRDWAVAADDLRAVVQPLLDQAAKDVVTVEDLEIPRADLPAVLGNFVRAARDARDQAAKDRAEAWSEGYDAGYEMARLWGHVDHWEDEPTNPYLASTTERPDTENSDD